MAIILGLTGSIGSGKSLVSSLLRQANAPVIDADQAAREAVLPGRPAFLEIREHFGKEIATPAGLDRAKLAKIVFNNPDERRALERMVHPRVREAELEFIETHRKEPLAVLEVPLLFETDFYRDCDCTLLVLLEREIRYQRLQETRSMTREQVDQRLNTQMSQEKKAQMTDFFVDNSRSRSYTCIQLNRILQHLFNGSLPEPIQLIHHFS